MLARSMESPVRNERRTPGSGEGARKRLRASEEPRRAPILHFSRRILAWRICEKLDPLTTVAILREAAVHIGITPMLVADSGIENVNAELQRS